MSFLIRNWKITRSVLLIVMVCTILINALKAFLIEGDWILPSFLLAVPCIAFVMFFLIAKVLPAMSVLWKRTLFQGLSITFFPKLYFLVGLIGLGGIMMDHRTLQEGVGIPLGAIVGMLCTLGNFLHGELRKSSLPSADRTNER